MSTADIRELLKRRRTALQGRLKNLRNELTHAESGSRDSSELALEQESDEVLDRLASNMMEEIRHVDAALARVRAGTYGLCEFCKEVIDEQRLHALPMTTLCSECAHLELPKLPGE